MIFMCRALFHIRVIKQFTTKTLRVAHLNVLISIYEYLIRASELDNNLYETSIFQIR